MSQEPTSIHPFERRPGNEYGARALLVHRQLIGQRLYLYCLARYLVVAAVAIGSVFAPHVVGIQGLPTASLLLLALLLGAYNSIFFFVVRPYRKADAEPRVAGFLERLMHLTIFGDFLFLTAALWMVGGARSPFQAFYLFHVVLAGVLLSRRAAFGYALLAYALFGGMVMGQWLELLPSIYPEGAVLAGPLTGRYVATILVVEGLLILLTVALLTSLTKLLRQGERRIRAANAELEAMADVQRDFLHIALHNLKSPVAAVSYLMENLEADLPELSEQQAHWLDRSKTRLRELTAFLRDLQSMAALESGELAKQTEQIDVAALLKKLVEEYQDLAAQQRHTLVCDCPADLPPVQGIERLLHEALTNYVTNAIKYTPEGGRIVVAARAKGDFLRLEVTDSGIGIDSVSQKRLFREFTRLKPKDSPLGQVPGSGLGLSIVRRVADLHGGSVGVRSKEGEGSTFYMDLPLHR
jgi:signal transduction histidine kinase